MSIIQLLKGMEGNYNMLSTTDSTSNILINLKIKTNDQFGNRSSKSNWFQIDRSSNQWSNWFQFGNIPQKQLNNTNHGREKAYNRTIMSMIGWGRGG